jgi:uncharacterized membrane protein YvbJ
MRFCPECGYPIEDYCEVCPWCSHNFQSPNPQKDTKKETKPKTTYIAPQEDKDHDYCSICFFLVAGIMFIIAFYLLYQLYY